MIPKKLSMMLDGKPIEVTVFPAARFPSPQPTEAMVKMPSGATHSVVLPPETRAALLEFTEIGQLLARLHAREEDGSLILKEVFNGLGIETEMGTFGIAQRDGGVFLRLDGAPLVDITPGAPATVVVHGAEGDPIPPMMTIVSGGKLAPGAEEKIQAYIQEHLARRPNFGTLGLPEKLSARRADLTPRCSKCQSVFTERESIQIERGSQGIIAGIRHEVCPEEPTLTGATRCRFHDVDLAPGLACGKCAEEREREMQMMADHIMKVIPGHLEITCAGQSFVSTVNGLVDKLIAIRPAPFSEEHMATVRLAHLVAYMAKNFPEQGPAGDPVRAAVGVLDMILLAAGGVSKSMVRSAAGEVLIGRRPTVEPAPEPADLIGNLVRAVEKILLADPLARVLALCTPGTLDLVTAALQESTAIELRPILGRQAGLWTREAHPRAESNVTVASLHDVEIWGDGRFDTVVTDMPPTESDPRWHLLLQRLSASTPESIVVLPVASAERGPSVSCFTLRFNAEARPTEQQLLVAGPADFVASVRRTVFEKLHGYGATVPAEDPAVWAKAPLSMLGIRVSHPFTREVAGYLKAGWFEQAITLLEQAPSLGLPEALLRDVMMLFDWFTPEEPIPAKRLHELGEQLAKLTPHGLPSDAAAVLALARARMAKG